jgi:hypothetical protein
MESERALQSLSDDELLRRLGELVGRSRRVEADLVAHIGEVDERRRYAREASPSMFAYCTEVLHLSEAEAYLRITVARAAREHPILLAMLGDGRLHLTGIAKLVPQLTLQNRDVLLKRATYRSKRQIEELVAELSPRPDAPTLMRKLPEKRPAPTPAAPQDPNRAGAAGLELGPDGAEAVRAPAAGSDPDGAGTTVSELCPDGVVAASARSAASVPLPASHLALPVTSSPAAVSAATRPAVVEPLSPARYRVQFTASAELHDKLERLQALLRHEVPDGDLAAIIEQAVTEKLERLETRRYAKTSAPRKALSQTHTSPASRHIPAAVRCARATETAATTSTSRVDAAPSGTGSSSITSTHSAWAETTARRTSACCAGPTTRTWPSAITASLRWAGTDDQRKQPDRPSTPRGTGVVRWARGRWAGDLAFGGVTGGRTRRGVASWSPPVDRSASLSDRVDVRADLPASAAFQEDSLMKTIAKLGLALALVVGFVAAASAGDETTVNGKIMCAKCTLKKADAKECQDVLVAKDAAGQVTEYYVEKNEIAKAYGHTCQGEKPAVVTGKVTEKDGKKWISATKMEAPKS